ncbi:putative cleavage and polyadenylation specificity factor subunit 4-like protein [Malurus melanocephalus]|uniref:putative cleavage and polyadenylation specificity factor subunit 4-like protein n=1 Tax=Malurus melanocephalus TaxID=175006 RepID=UPI002547BD1D|nr:putative cleavage and polyadenylation specificity factor subunit 4-like protein [Malurus melanocephalus]
MQELVAGVEKISFDSEAEAEQQRGARSLPLAGVDGAQGPAGRGGAKPAVCKHWLRGLCRRGDSCDFLHDHDTARVPECYFYSRFAIPVAFGGRCPRCAPAPPAGECSNKDCPFPHVDGTASTVGCPWYDRGFCRRGPLCKYKHTRRVMCSNYLVGFCPEGPKCKFVHLKAGLMTSSTDPAKEAGCPWGLLQRDLAAGEERGGEDVPPKEPPTRVTQQLAAPLWDTEGCPPSTQNLLEGGTCSKVRDFGSGRAGSRDLTLERWCGDSQ